MKTLSQPVKTASVALLVLSAVLSGCQNSVDPADDGTNTPGTVTLVETLNVDNGKEIGPYNIGPSRLAFGLQGVEGAFDQSFDYTLWFKNDNLNKLADGTTVKYSNASGSLKRIVVEGIITSNINLDTSGTQVTATFSGKSNVTIEVPHETATIGGKTYVSVNDPYTNVPAYMTASSLDTSRVNLKVTPGAKTLINGVLKTTPQP